MKVIRRCICLLIGLLTVSQGLEYQFLSRTLSSNMVLQRDTELPIYGYTSHPNTTISLRVTCNSTSNETYTTQSSTHSSNPSSSPYRWSLHLPPHTGGPRLHTIDIQSTTGESAYIDNIVFGDVFMCSGQSNMQLGMGAIHDHTWQDELHDSHFIRVFTVGFNTSMSEGEAMVPKDDVSAVSYGWYESNYDVIRPFSAVCWTYGRYLYTTTLNRSIPVGLVSVSWPGTPIEAWSPDEVNDECNSRRRLRGKTVNNGVYDIDTSKASVLYNNMIHPLRYMAFRGILWYQGEANVPFPDRYYCFQTRMIHSWRNLFNTTIPFLYTQLAPWNNDGEGKLARFRDMQATLSTATDMTSMATAADLGDPSSPYGDIHPRNKTEVGRRLAIAAAGLIYDEDGTHEGPKVESAEVVRNEVVGSIVRVTMTESTVGSGLELRPHQACPSNADINDDNYDDGIYYPDDAYFYSDSGAYGEEVCEGASLLFFHHGHITRVPATAVVSSNTTVDFIPQYHVHGKLVQLQYGHADYPLMTVYNSRGLPLLPQTIDIHELPPGSLPLIDSGSFRTKVSFSALGLLISFSLAVILTY